MGSHEMSSLGVTLANDKHSCIPKASQSFLREAIMSSDGREEVTVTKRLADGSSTTETRVTAGEGANTALDGGWTVVPRGGMSVPGPRDEMLGQNPESVLGDLWQTFFGK